MITAEEHNYYGGLGESIARTLAQHHPTQQEFVATQDTFGESGKPHELLDKYGLNAQAIMAKAEKLMR